MKKQCVARMICLLAALLCTGCANRQPTQQDPFENVLYSNLVDASTQQAIADTLENHGVQKAQVETLLSWVEDFNSRVVSDPMPEGFQIMAEPGKLYQGLIIQNKELEDGEIAPEANCRLTSYLLMKNWSHTNGTHADNDTFLMFDLEAVDTYEPFQLSEEERNQFASLFSWVSVEDASTVEEHLERIQETWKEREILIDGDGISLITVYVHSPFEEVRFVGHTGVLLETDEGLLFVEKYGRSFRSRRQGSMIASS